MASLRSATIPTPPPLPSIPYESEPKSNPKLLSLFLKAIVVTLLLTFFLFTLALALFLVLLLCLFRAVLQRFRLRSGTAPLDAGDNLAHSRVHNGPESDEAPCVICLEGLRNGECCRKLARCGHVFHGTCIGTWLVRVAACPICRTPARLRASAAAAGGSETEEEEGCRLWFLAINDINAFVALKLHFLAYRLL